MKIQELSREECLAELARTRLGRLACAHEGQPYVVPIYFVLDRPTLDEACLYSFSARGQKIEWMRANPLVCVEIDEVKDRDQWKSIIVFGHFEELPERPDIGPKLRGVASRQSQPPPERHHAWQLLKTYPIWWQPGSLVHRQGDGVRVFQPVFYRIHIDQITGRHAMPSSEEAMRSRMLCPARADRDWLRRAFRAFLNRFPVKHR